MTIHTPFRFSGSQTAELQVQIQTAEDDALANAVLNSLELACGGHFKVQKLERHRLRMPVGLQRGITGWRCVMHRSAADIHAVRGIGSQAGKVGIGKYSYHL